MSLLKDALKSDSNLEELRTLSSKLTETESELSAFFNLSPVLMIVADAGGYFKKVNAHWTRCLGWTPEEMCVSPWLSFVHPDDVERTRNIASLQLGNDIKYFYNRYRAKDGRYHTIRWLVSKFVNGRTTYGIAEDVTGTPEELA